MDGSGRGIAVKTLVLIGFVGLTLAACARQVPDSGAGVGFSDFSQFELERARREAALRGTPAGGPDLLPPLGAPFPAGSSPRAAGAIPSSDLAAAGIGTGFGAPPPVTSGPLVAPGIGQTLATAPVQRSVLTTVPGQGGLDIGRSQGIEASPSNAAPAIVNSSAISDEQDFDAVAGRETIESDAQRRAAQAAAYQLVQPGAVPVRTGDTGPNIVAYALDAPNVKGQEWYSRLRISGQGRFERNCAAYTSPDEAQRDFLSRGGPDRDPRGIDPDGDGFACGWDPAPFRLAVRN